MQLPQLNDGPVALILNEDDVELSSTVDHTTGLGFSNVFTVGATPKTRQDVPHVAANLSLGLSKTLNPILDELHGRWVYYGYNAEYLYFPFCEVRSISDAAQFVSEERRSSVFGVAVDLYADDILAAPDAIDLETPRLDAAGYFRLDRFDGPNRIDRQIHVYGGLKWRFSEHVPWPRQTVERICFFRAEEGLTISDNGVLSDPERNTYTCPWHNSLTFAVASFRVAKSLLNNPGSTERIETLVWPGSARFDWSSHQLMDLGFMEPGQWF